MQAYQVRVIDARDDWTKIVKWFGWYNDELRVSLSAAKSSAYTLTSLTEAVNIRNALNKREHIKSAWIVHV